MKNSIAVLAIIIAFVIGGFISTSPQVEAAGGWKESFEQLLVKINVLEDKVETLEENRQQTHILRFEGEPYMIQAESVFNNGVNFDADSSGNEYVFMEWGSIAGVSGTITSYTFTIQKPDMVANIESSLYVNGDTVKSCDFDVDLTNNNSEGKGITDYYVWTCTATDINFHVDENDRLVFSDQANIDPLVDRLNLVSKQASVTIVADP